MARSPEEIERNHSRLSKGPRPDISRETHGGSDADTPRCSFCHPRRKIQNAKALLDRLLQIVGRTIERPWPNSLSLTAPHDLSRTPSSSPIHSETHMHAALSASPTSGSRPSNQLAPPSRLPLLVVAIAIMIAGAGLIAGAMLSGVGTTPRETSALAPAPPRPVPARDRPDREVQPLPSLAQEEPPSAHATPEPMEFFEDEEEIETTEKEGGETDDPREEDVLGDKRERRRVEPTNKRGRVSARKTLPASSTNDPVPVDSAPSRDEPALEAVEVDPVEESAEPRQEEPEKETKKVRRVRRVKRVIRRRVKKEEDEDEKEETTPTIPRGL